MNFHWRRYYRNLAIGVGFEHTFNGYYALRIGLGWWFFSITWKERQRA